MLLVTIDTWRWDYFGAAGVKKVRTPNLDQMARSGAYIKTVHTSAPLTTPAHATILTGLNPYRHGIRDNLHFKLKAGVDTLAQAFHRGGYQTAAFVSAEPLRRATGLDRGFDTYNDQGLARPEQETVEPTERTAFATVAALEGWLAQRREGRKLFLWVHFYDPHFPYRAPELYAGKPAIDAYAGEIEFTDRAVGKLMKLLEKHFGRGGIKAVITGDHGEGLGEHGESTHGAGLYEPTLSVPLVFWPAPPKVSGAGPWSLTDVAPSLLQWAGLTPIVTDGQSVFTPLRDPQRWIYSEALAPSFSFGISPAYALRRDSEVALLHGAKEVYNTLIDPAQANNLAAGTSQNFYLVARQKLIELLAVYPEADLAGGAAAPSPDELNRLRSLGYIGGSMPTPARPWERDDRRKFLRQFEILKTARGALMKGKYALAIQGYREFLQAYPDGGQAHQELGVALVRKGELAAAQSELERAFKLDPLDAIAALNLGNLAMVRKDHPAARNYYERSLFLDPTQPEAQINMAQSFLAEGMLQDAVPYLRQFLVLAPNDRDADKARKLLAEAAATEQR